MQVVGGGLAGLTAAITAQELGVDVHLHEAAKTLGGRARTLEGPYKANFGPHALYADGPTYAWLKERNLLPELRRPKASGFYFGVKGRRRRMPWPVVSAALRLGGEGAPVDQSFRSWATERVGTSAAEAAAGVASLPTYYHDPGELSAAFVQERFLRIARKSSATRYIVGGWKTLIEALRDHACELGVEIHTSSRVSEVTDRPVVVALGPRAASELLGETLKVETSRAALLDVAVGRQRRWPAALLDLDQRVYISRPSASVPDLAPAGQDLIQASAGLQPREGLDEAVKRIESVMDYGFDAWRSREVWRNATLSNGGSGAIDAPGADWRDRPSIDHGGGIYLAGDYVAAPGMLSEMAHNSGVEAASLAAASVADHRLVKR